MGKIKEQVESKVEEILSKPYRIDLHNDDYNSFDWVITCLMKICNHEEDQANQCCRPRCNHEWSWIDRNSS